VTFEEISLEFIQENQNNLCQFMPKSHKRGPYSKQELEKRRNEVYRLHFEYGYSARKIAELMKINRNTINGDIKHWYSKIGNKANTLDPESMITLTIERLDIQRTRLREYLDKVAEIQEKIPLERMMCGIDCKMANIRQKVIDSSAGRFEYGISFLNEYLKSKNDNDRFLTFYDKIKISIPAKKKIDKIIKEDEKNLWSRQN